MARLLLGVSGGIAAYKAVEIVRLATAAGHAVRVVQTASSLRFVGKATFEGVTGAPVLVDEFEPDPARGAVIVEPGTGRLASKGEWGAGRLADPAEIFAEVERAFEDGRFTPRSLDGLRVLVTAGGTREPIDSVRYVGNRSSGRMGVALADEAARRGADVTLIAANVSLERPDGVRVVDVETAAELEGAARAEFPAIDVLLMAAAVADFRPAAAQDTKITKTGRDELVLSLEPTTDVLGALAEARRPGQTLVGFAAEHGDGGLDHARSKLERKRLDAVVLNDISRADIGFESEDNEVTILTRQGERPVPQGPKAAVAAAILDCVEKLRAEAPHPAPEVGGR